MKRENSLEEAEEEGIIHLIWRSVLAKKKNALKVGLIVSHKDQRDGSTRFLDDSFQRDGPCL